MVQSDSTSDKWDRVRPEATVFWYRQAPRALMRTTDLFPGVNDDDPPRVDSGDVTIWLNAWGQIRDFTAIPPQVLEAGPAPPPVDWPALFRAGGIDYASAAPVTPEWAPLYYGDKREAWTAAIPGVPETPGTYRSGEFRGTRGQFLRDPSVASSNPCCSTDAVDR